MVLELVLKDSLGECINQVCQLIKVHVVFVIILYVSCDNITIFVSCDNITIFVSCDNITIFVSCDNITIFVSCDNITIFAVFSFNEKKNRFTALPSASIYPKSNINHDIECILIPITRH